MKSILLILFVGLNVNFPQESNTSYLNREIKNIEFRGTLINKIIINNTFVFKIKNDNSNEIKKMILPESIYNSKIIYEFIVPGDIFIKLKGDLKVRIAHKFDGNLEVRQLELLSQDE